MIAFLTENLGNIIVGIIVLAIVVAVAVKLIKDKRNHKSSCSCGCTGCLDSCACHQDKSDETGSPPVEIKRSGPSTRISELR